MHWAFRKPVKPAVPKVSDATWVRNAIDSFVLARLDREGLKPSAEAERATLLRRVSLDLVGLPPTPEEVDAFLADQSPDAYERRVDGLLASPHYGERWARRWLDVARYADTNGYEKDRPRSIWPYRDWVINALNANVPFDRFTTEQLAGDMLPGAGVSQKVATGFHRNTMLNEEGGIDPLEFRFYAMTDRVATTGTVWLGLTIGCAQCHTHKFDPIPHRDYYQFMALLNNADEPKMPVPSAATAERRRSIEARVAAMKAELANQFPLDEKGVDASKEKAGDAEHLARRRRAHLERRFQEWLRGVTAETARWEVLEPKKAESNVPRLAIEPGGSVFASGDMSKRDVYTIGVWLDAQDDHGDSPRGAAGRPASEPGAGAGLLRGAVRGFLSERDQAVGWREEQCRSRRRRRATRRRRRTRRRRSMATRRRGGRSMVGKGASNRRCFGWPHRWRARARSRSRWYSSGITRRGWVDSGSRRRPTLGRSRRGEIPFELEPLLLIPEGKRKPEEVERLRQYYLSVAPELAAARGAIEKLASEIPEDPTTLVMAERPPENPRPTFVHQPRRVLAAEGARRAGGAVDAAGDGGGPAAQPAGAGALAGFRVEPAHGPRDDELPVGGVFRQGNRADRGRFRISGRAAVAPGPAGLPGGFAGRAGMVDEGDAQGDRDECDLPAGFAGLCPRCWRRTPKTGCWHAGRECVWRPRSSATRF